MASVQYNVPTRNASVLGYGGLRPDGRLKERRRPSSVKGAPPHLVAQARAIPNGTGEDLMDEELMILCFLPRVERHGKFNQLHDVLPTSASPLPFSQLLSSSEQFSVYCVATLLPKKGPC